MNPLQSFFLNLIGKSVIFTLPQEDAIRGVLIDYSDGYFLVESHEPGVYVALNQSLILMVSAYSEPKDDSDDTSTNPDANDNA